MGGHFKLKLGGQYHWNLHFLTFIIYKQQKEINSIKKNINVKKDDWSNQSFDSSFNNDEINDKVLNLEREIEDLKSEVETLKLNLNNF